MRRICKRSPRPTGRRQEGPRQDASLWQTTRKNRKRHGAGCLSGVNSQWRLAVFVAGAFHCSSSQHPRSRRHREEGELRKQARPELGSQVNRGRSTPPSTGRGVSSALRAGVACRLGSWAGRPRRHLPLSTILPGGEGCEWACRKSAHCANVQAIQAFAIMSGVFLWRQLEIAWFSIFRSVFFSTSHHILLYADTHSLDFWTFWHLHRIPASYPPRAPMPRSSP